MRILIGMMASSIALTGCSYSSHGPAENRSVERSGMVASGDVDATGSAEFSGMIVSAGGNVERNLDLAGAMVSSNAHVGGNLSAAGARVRFTGRVGGNTDVEAATAYLDGDFTGNVSIVGARLTIDGDIHGSLFANGAHIQLAGRFAEPVEVIGEGNRRNGRAIISGELQQGGLICASHVEFASDARVAGDLTVISNERPDASGHEFNYEALAGRDCDQL